MRKPVIEWKGPFDKAAAAANEQLAQGREAAGPASPDVGVPVRSDRPVSEGAAVPGFGDVTRRQKQRPSVLAQEAANLCQPGSELDRTGTPVGPGTVSDPSSDEDGGRRREVREDRLRRERRRVRDGLDPDRPGRLHDEDR